MPTRERLAAIGTALGRQLVREFGESLRQARLAGALSQAEVGRAAGISKTSVSRIERGQPPLPNFIVAARVARIVGLNLSVRCFPAGSQLRDAGHVALIKRLVARLPSNVARQVEAPVKAGDLRAWDLLLQIGDVRIGVIAETRIRDLQALLRREHLKQVDGGVDRLLLVVADTRHNRAALEEAGSLLLASFPLGTRATLIRLSHSEAPTADGIVIL